MKKKIIVSFASILVVAIVFLSVQPTQGQSNFDPIVSSNENIELVRLEPYRLQSNHWTYIVNVCATSHSIDVDKVILKSDKDEQILGVNKTIEKGKCSPFGSIMKGIDSESFSAKIIEHVR